MNLVQAKAEEVIRRTLQENVAVLAPPTAAQAVRAVFELINPPLAAAIAASLQKAGLLTISTDISAASLARDGESEQSALEVGQS